jgi:hypothetical protein
MTGLALPCHSPSTGNDEEGLPSTSGCDWMPASSFRRSRFLSDCPQCEVQVKVMPIFLNRLAIQFFRGIGKDIQKLDPFKGFNFFVGANNVGKSTVLDCLHRYAKQIGPQLIPSDIHRGASTGEFTLGFPIPKTEFIKRVSDQIKRGEFNPLIDWIVTEHLAVVIIFG